MLRHTRSPEHLYALDKLFDCLPTNPEPHAKKLWNKLDRCGQPLAYSRRYQCGSPSCPHCQDLRSGRERRTLQRRYSAVPSEDLGLISIVFGATAPDDIDAIGAIWTNAKTTLRNHLDYQRRRDPAWKDVELTLWLEVDCVRVEDIPRLGDEKRRQYNELRHIPFDASGTIWIVTAHGLLHTGPDLSVDQVQISLMNRLFPKHNQVDIAQLSDEKEVRNSIGDIVNYALKRKCETTFVDDRSLMWDADQIVDFALWQERFSRGFQSLVMKFGMRKRAEHSVREVESDEREFIEKHSPYYTGSTPELSVGQPLRFQDKYLNRLIFWAERAEMLSFKEWLGQRDQIGATSLLLEDVAVPSAPAVSSLTEKLLREEVTPVAPSTRVPLRMEKHRLTMKDVFTATDERPRRLSGGRYRTMGDALRAADTSSALSKRA